MSEGHRVNSSCGTAEPIRNYTVDSKEVPSPGKLPGHLGGALCVHKQNQFGTGTSLRLNHFLCSLSKNELYFSSRSETGNIGTWLFWGFLLLPCVWKLSQKNRENETFIFLPSETVSSFLGRGARVGLEPLSSWLCEEQTQTGDA